METSLLPQLLYHACLKLLRLSQAGPRQLFPNRKFLPTTWMSALDFLGLRRQHPSTSGLDGGKCYLRARSLKIDTALMIRRKPLQALRTGDLVPISSQNLPRICRPFQRHAQSVPAGSEGCCHGSTFDAQHPCDLDSRYAASFCRPGCSKPHPGWNAVQANPDYLRVVRFMPCQTKRKKCVGVAPAGLRSVCPCKSSAAQQPWMGEADINGHVLHRLIDWRAARACV